jgi:hypothetical protein
VNWSVNATITDNTKPNLITITLPAELTLLGVDAPKGAKVTVKGGVITITIDPGVALGPYPTMVVRTYPSAANSRPAASTMASRVPAAWSVRRVDFAMRLDYRSTH